MPAPHVVSTKLTPFEAMEIMDMSVKELADQTGLNLQAVRRAVMGGSIRTNISTARCIAEALELKVEDIDWPSGLTNVGRPALTGHPIGESSSGGIASVTGRVVHHHDDTPFERRRVPVESTTFCPEHRLLLSLSGECSMCAA